MSFDFMGWLQAARQTSSKRDLYVMFDNISKLWEQRAMPQEQYEELRDYLKYRLNNPDRPGVVNAEKLKNDLEDIIHG